MIELLILVGGAAVVLLGLAHVVQWIDDWWHRLWRR